MSTFRQALLEEIEQQKKLIERMDARNTLGFNVMAQIRQEKLAALQDLLGNWYPQGAA